jgi:hypothetical protein
MPTLGPQQDLVYIEILPSIGSLTAFVTFSPHNRQHLKLDQPDIQRKYVTFYPKPTSVSFAQVICLPDEIDIHSAKVEYKAENKVVEVKASLASGKLQLSSPETSTLSASDLIDLQSIHCHKCQLDLLRPISTTVVGNSVFQRGVGGQTQTLNNERRFRKVADLPSEYWHELIDCWTCHQEDYSHLQKGHIANVIPARQNVALIGRGHVVLHTDDVQMDSIRFEEPAVIDADQVKASDDTEQVSQVVLDERNL